MNIFSFSKNCIGFLSIIYEEGYLLEMSIYERSFVKVEGIPKSTLHLILCHERVI